MEGLVGILLFAAVTIFLMTRRPKESPIAATLREAQAAFDERKFANSRAFYDEALEKCEDAGDDEWRATALSGLGHAEFELGNFKVAEELFLDLSSGQNEELWLIELSSRIMLARISASNNNKPELQGRMATLHRIVSELSLERVGEAAEYLCYSSQLMGEGDLPWLEWECARLAIEQLDRFPESNADPELAVYVLNNFLRVLLDRREVGQAHEISKRALQWAERSESLEQIVYALQLAGHVDQELLEVESAESHLTQALSLAESGPAQLSSFASLRGAFASFYLARGQLLEALDHQQRGIDLLDRFLDENVGIFNGYLFEAQIHQQMADFENAFICLENAKTLKSSEGIRRRDLAILHASQGGILIDCGEKESGIKQLKRAVELEESIDEQGYNAARVRLNLLFAQLLVDENAASAALRCAQRVLDQDEGVVRIDAMMLAAQANSVLGDLDRAEELARDAVQLQRGQCQGRSPISSYATVTLGMILLKSGRPKEAEACLLEGIQLREEQPGFENCPSTARLLETLAEVMKALDNSARMRQLNDQAREIRKRLADIRRRFSGAVEEGAD